jgi:hypothetical protein
LRKKRTEKRTRKQDKKKLVPLSAVENPIVVKKEVRDNF